MKNKTKTYILLILVLCIWGVIAYRFFSFVNPQPLNVVAKNLGASFSPKWDSKVDTFSIQQVSRDPFLGTLYKKNTSAKKVKKDVVVWKPITYHGSISKPNSISQIYVVTIDKQQHLLRLRQEVNGVKLVSANAKSITVFYKGKRKVVNKT